MAELNKIWKQVVVYTIALLRPYNTQEYWLFCSWDYYCTHTAKWSCWQFSAQFTKVYQSVDSHRLLY